MYEVFDAVSGETVLVIRSRSAARVAAWVMRRVRRGCWDWNLSGEGWL